MNEVIHQERPETESGEPCPTPLEWQEVVQAFLADRREEVLKSTLGSLTVTQFGHGQPLLVLPGTVGSPKLFALTAWLLKDEFQVTLFDHPHFEKQISAGDYLRVTVDLYQSVFSELFRDPVDVYAPTLGAQLALQMLKSRPDWIRRVILQSGWAHRSLTLAERGLLQLGRPFSSPMQRVPLWLSSQVANHRPWFPPFDETRFGFLLSELYKTPVNTLCLRMRAAQQTDLSESLAQITNEILLLRTEGDGKAIERQEDLLESKLPFCRSEWLHTTGHFVFLTHPHRLVKILRQFYNSDSSSPSDQSLT